jgi:hypothetical protein
MQSNTVNRSVATIQRFDATIPFRPTTNYTKRDNGMDELTVGELKRRLQGLDDNTKVSFAGGLTFFDFKRWSNSEFIIEFNEPEAYLTDEFKQRNPHVQVAFIRSDAVDRDADGIIGHVDVTVE